MLTTQDLKVGTKPARVKRRQNMNIAMKLTIARTRKTTRLHKDPTTLCSEENLRKPIDQTESLVIKF